MSCNRYLPIGILAALLMSSMTRLEIVQAAENTDLQFDATERGMDGSLPPILGQGFYRYTGPEDFAISGPVTRFDKLQVGNALPVAGAIYRVRTANDRQLVLQFIPEKELPEDCRLTKGSYAIPLKCIGRLGHWELLVDEISEVDGKSQARILGVHRAGGLSGNYRRGDSLNVDGWKYRILNIVTPRKGYAGWIEVDRFAVPGPPAPNPNMEIKVSATGLEILKDGKLGQAVPFVDEAHRKAMTDFIAEHKGSTIAFLGKAYRVDEVDDTRIRCTLVPWSEFAPEVEAGVGHSLLPIGALQNLNSWSFRITEIVGEGAARVAPFEGVGEAKGKLASYKVGDAVTINGFTRRVVNLVPSDEARKLIGWVELSPVEPAGK